jgi:hypothetical protein
VLRQCSGGEEVAVSKSTRIRSAFGMRVVGKKEKENKNKNAWRRRVG